MQYGKRMRKTHAEIGCDNSALLYVLNSYLQIVDACLNQQLSDENVHEIV